MAWYRVDDEFDDDEDLDRMTCEAITLNLCAGTWSSRKMTDGFIPETRVRKLKGGENGVPECLLSGEFPWWVKVEGGYQIRNFLKFNPSKAEVLARQAERSESGKKGAEKRWNSSSHSNSHSVSNSKPDGKMDAPYPVSRIRESSQLQDSPLDTRENPSTNLATGKRSPDLKDIPVRENPVPIDEYHESGVVTTVKRVAEVAALWKDFVSAYPKRDGDRKVAGGEKKFRALVKSGVPPGQILDGVKRYRAWCDKTGKTGSSLVQQMTTWLNGRAWDEPWELSPDLVKAEVKYIDKSKVEIPVFGRGL